jgi:dual specificity phosphatase 12
MSNETPTQLLCKSCRKNVVVGTEIKQHAPGKGQDAFGFRKRSAMFDRIQQTDERDPCHHWFVDNFETISETQGKLLCPHCSAKLGYFHLAGRQCSCGSWVGPAYAISKSNVDAVIAHKSDAISSNLNAITAGLVLR